MANSRPIPLPTERQLKATLKSLKYSIPAVAAKHLCAVVESFKELRPSVKELVFEPSGTRVDLIQLNGTIPVSIVEKVYNIPVRVWLRKQYPKDSPLVYINPTGKMTVAMTPGYILADGRVLMRYLESWRASSSDLTTLVQYLRAEFSHRCPVYTISSLPRSPVPPPSPSLPTALSPRSSVTLPKTLKPHAPVSHKTSLPPLPSTEGPDEPMSARQQQLPLSAPPAGYAPQPSLATRLKQLEEELRYKQREKAALQQSLREENLSSDQHVAEVTHLQRQLSIEKESNRQHRQEIGQLQQHLSGYDVDVDTLRSKIQATEREAIKAKEDAAVAQMECNEAQEELGKVRKRLSSAMVETERQTQTTMKLQHQLKTIHKELTEAKGEIEAHKASAIAHQQVIRAVPLATIEFPPLANDHPSEKERELETENDKLHCKLDATKALLNESQRDLESLKIQNHSLFLQLGRLQTDDRRVRRLSSKEENLTREDKPLYKNVSTEELIVTFGDDKMDGELSSSEESQEDSESETGSAEEVRLELTKARHVIQTLEAAKSTLKQSLTSKEIELTEVKQELQAVKERSGKDSRLSTEEDSKGEGTAMKSVTEDNIAHTGQRGNMSGHEAPDSVAAALNTVIEEGEPGELIQLREEAEKLRQKVHQMSDERQELMTSFLKQIQTTMEIETQKEALQTRLKEALEVTADRKTPTKSMCTISYSEIEVNTERMLGTGAWGYVMEGHFRGKVVAVKCIHKDIFTGFTVSQLQREIGIMANLRHPNLVLFIAAAMDAPSGPVIVTELLTKTLRAAYIDDSIKSSKLPVLRDVACALNYLHLQKIPIIHRDVSSSNVLLEELPNGKWRGKVSDFGSANLARLANTPGPGAAVYAAPEMRLTDANQTPAVDVYSFGILVCEVATGAFPLREQFRAMVTLTQSQWPKLHDIITHCVLEKPEERLSMGEVITKLDNTIKSGKIY